MKLKLVIFAVLVIAGLWFANNYLNRTSSVSPGFTGPTTDGAAEAGKEAREQFKIGHLPVTCHLTCPVTSWVTKHSTSGTEFQSMRFGDFSAMREALIARKIDAAFLNVLMPVKLAMDGIPVKIVYLGHRDGSAIVVPTDDPIQDFTGLKGKKVAIPSRFSNQYLLMRKMMKQHGMAETDITMVEIPPPDHPSSLASKAVDAYIIGEPHAARAEIAGFGRVLYHMKDLWPGFISCVLVVREEVINERRDLVDELVRGIAASGEWLDEDIDTGAQHRKDAAFVVGKLYYNQDPKLLEFVLTKPLDRVGYTNLKPIKENLEEIVNLGVEMGVLPKALPFEAYCDTSFAPDLTTVDMPLDRLPMPTEAELAAAK